MNVWILERANLRYPASTVLGVYENAALALHNPELPSSLTWYENGYLVQKPIQDPDNPHMIYRLRSFKFQESI